MSRCSKRISWVEEPTGTALKPQIWVSYSEAGGELTNSSIFAVVNAFPPSLVIFAGAGPFISTPEVVDPVVSLSDSINWSKKKSSRIAMILGGDYVKLKRYMCGVRGGDFEYGGRRENKGQRAF